jgi:hypothetical protein
MKKFIERFDPPMRGSETKVGLLIEKKLKTSKMSSPFPPLLEMGLRGPD